MIQRILVLGGGSAGFLAAISLKITIPDLDVSVVRSKHMGTDIAYHIENRTFVAYLESYAARIGIAIHDDLVSEVTQDEAGLAGLVLKSGDTLAADLYIDCSGFGSLLLGKTLHEPYQSF